MSEETAGGNFRFNVNIPPPSPIELQDKNGTTKAEASSSSGAAPSASSSASIEEDFVEHGKFAFPGTQGKPGFNLSGNIDNISDGPRYLPIDSYGVIGNMKTAALVGIDGSIDWCCMPYFNSPSIFGRILDQNIGGYFQVRAVESKTCKQHYWPDTNILVTRFMSNEGVGQLVDFMPVVKGDPMIPPDVKSNKFAARSASSSGTPTPGPRNSLISNMCNVAKQKRGSSYHWIVRRLEAVHGKVCFVLNCFPAFNYARDEHTVHLAEDGRRAIFRSKDLTLVLESSHIELEIVKCPYSGKFGVTQKFCLDENCAISFVLRIHKERKVKRRKTLANLFKIGKQVKERPAFADRAMHAWTPSETTSGLTIQIPQQEHNEEHTDEEDLHDHYYSGDEPTADPKCKSKYDFKNYSVDLGDYADYDEDIEDALELHSLVDWLFMVTMKFWHGWIKKCTYDGRYREEIHRSALILKLMTFERTGAIVASITTSLPESLGENRNWDYRYTWIRDASFTLYAFLRIGFTEEAEQFMHFLEARCKEMDKHQKKTKNPKRPPLQVMYGIDGSHSLPEEELKHLEGYKGSRPVRIGNGAHDQLQLDVSRKSYGELLDSCYLFNKYATPIAYDLWKYIRKIIDWVCDNWTAPDEGIWEVRGGKKHFLYSKVMCWVCIDRGIRLAERRSFPADRQKWLKVRDQIYEEVMKKGYNRELKAFTQYYGSNTLDASALILPLVFFVSPSDPRMIHTLNAITKSPKEGGLVSSSLVYRYDVNQTDDGFTGIEEGTFNMCTFWLIEALTRAGKSDKKRLLEAQLMFEQMMTYSNHLKLFSEEMSFTGVALGNFPQAFTHLALISSAFNLNRTLNERG